MIFSNILQVDKVLPESSTPESKNQDRLLKAFFPRGITYVGVIINYVHMISANFAARLTMFMFSISISKPVKQKDKLFYNSGVRKIFKNGNYRYNVYEYGSGPKVLLVHGWTCRGARWKKYVDRIVDAGYTALVMDAPAHGTSPGFRLSVPDFVICTRVIINHYQGVHTIVSHSMGSIVSTIALSESRYSEADTKLVLMNSFADCDSLISRFATCIGINESVMAHTRDWISEYTYSPLNYFSMIDRLQFTKADVLLISDDQDIVVPRGEVSRILDCAYPIEHLRTNGLGHRLQSIEIVDRVVDHIAKCPAHSRV